LYIGFCRRGSRGHCPPLPLPPRFRLPRNPSFVATCLFCHPPDDPYFFRTRVYCKPSRLRLLFNVFLKHPRPFKSFPFFNLSVPPGATNFTQRIPSRPPPLKFFPTILVLINTEGLHLPLSPLRFFVFFFHEPQCPLCHFLKSSPVPRSFPFVPVLLNPC